MIAPRNLKKDIYRSMLEPFYAIDTLKKRLGCYLDYRFASVPRSFPESVTFFLTHECNLRCAMCGQSKIKDRAGGLGLEELKKVIDGIAPFKPNITLYGGEPLLYKDAGRIIGYIKSKGLHLCIITNGTLLDRYAEEIVSSGVDVISVSIDGPSRIHDEIRGVPGAFGRIVSGVSKINKIKKELGKRAPVINIVTTISRLNYLSLEEMAEIARGLGAATLNFHHLIFIDRDTMERQNRMCGNVFGKIASDWEGFVLNGPENIDPDILTEKIKRLKRMKAGFLINFYPNFTPEEVKDYYSKPEFVPGSYGKRCLSPWMSAYIYPDGSVRPCLAVDYVAGNIKEEDFPDIWRNGRFNRFREGLKKINLFPVCPKCTEFYRY